MRFASSWFPLQKEFGVMIFPGGNHILRQLRLEHDRAVVEFFRRYVVK